MPITISNKITRIIIFTIPSFAALCFALFRLDYFGLEYDELIFANAALGDLDGTTFVQKKWGNVVFIVFNYIGAFKSWLYIPIFKLFGTSIWSVRLPMIAILLLNLALVYSITLKYFNRTVAYAVFCLLSVDLTFITLQRFDKGPSAVETCVKLLLLFVVLKQESLNKYLLIILLMGLGVFNKLNFLWLTNAFYGTLFLIEIKTVINFLRGRITAKDLVSSLIGRYTIIFLILSAGYLAYINFLKLHPASPPTAFEDVKHYFISQLKMLKYTVLGTRIFYLFGWDLRSNSLQFFGNLLFTGTILANIFIYAKKSVPYRSFHTANGFLILLLFCQIVMTVEAVNPWHTFVLYPFVIIFTVNTFYIVFGQHHRLFLGWVGFIITWIIANLYVQFKFIEITGSQCVSGEVFIPQMNDLVQYTNDRPENKILSVSWGVQTPLLITGDRKKKYLEPYHVTFSPKHLDKWFETHRTEIQNPDDVLLVNYVMQQTPVYGKQYVVTSDSSFRRYERMVRTKGQEPFLFHVIKNQCGKPVYHIYKMRPYASSVVVPRQHMAKTANNL